MPRRKKAPLTRETPVAELWNISDVSAAWLREEGVSTYGDLLARDPFELWVALKFAHHQVTRLMYFALWGARNDCHWRMIPDEEVARFESRRAALGEAAGGTPTKRARRAPA
jgi:hypothetical protein